MRSAETSSLRTSHSAIALKAGLGFGFGFPKACDAVAGLPLTALFEERDALKALHNVTFSAGRAGGAKTAMLCHKILLLYRFCLPLL
jgi:hypothetical protein